MRSICNALAFLVYLLGLEIVNKNSSLPKVLVILAQIFTDQLLRTKLLYLISSTQSIMQFKTSLLFACGLSAILAWTIPENQP